MKPGQDPDDYFTEAIIRGAEVEAMGEHITGGSRTFWSKEFRRVRDYGCLDLGDVKDRIPMHDKLDILVLRRNSLDEDAVASPVGDGYASTTARLVIASMK